MYKMYQEDQKFQKRLEKEMKFQQFVFANFLRVLRMNEIPTVMCRFCMENDVLKDTGTFVDHLKVSAAQTFK